MKELVRTNLRQNHNYEAQYDFRAIRILRHGEIARTLSFDTWPLFSQESTRQKKVAKKQQFFDTRRPFLQERCSAHGFRTKRKRMMMMMMRKKRILKENFEKDPSPSQTLSGTKTLDFAF